MTRLGAFFCAEKRKGLPMGNEQEFQDLLQHVGLDREEICQRLRFLDWSAADVDQLSRHSAGLQPAHADFLDHLYQRLGDFPATAAIVNDPATISPLKHRQGDYYQRLWNEIGRASCRERV